MTRFPSAAILALTLAMATAAAQDELLVYEPFDYDVGSLTARNGGIGFAGGWRNSDGAGSSGFVWDETTNATYDGATLDWDGILNNGFPTSPATGARYLGASAATTSNLNVFRELSASAGDLAGPDGVLWMSAVHRLPNRTFGAGIHIGLASGWMRERGRQFQSADTAFIGATPYTGASNNWNSGNLVPTVVASNTGTNAWQDFVRRVGPALPAASLDMIVVFKFTFGSADTVEAWVFSENVPLSLVTEAAFDANQTGVTYVPGIDQFELRYLVINQGRFNNAIDEIRIGRTIESVTRVPLVAAQPFVITEITRDPETRDISLAWTSNPGETYGIHWSPDLVTFYPSVHQAIPAHATDAITGFGPFPTPAPVAERLFLRVGPPDTTPPTLAALGGGGDRLVLTYSEPMLAGSATDPANYRVETSAGEVIAVVSASIGENPENVILMLGSLIEDGAHYLVTVNHVADPAGLPILADSRIGFTAWSSPIISEFMASNGSNMYGSEILLDEDGDSADWVEIFNPTADAVNLDGWHLTDNENNLAKWPFPAVAIAPGAHLIVFASGKDRRHPDGQLHTNFSLAAAGEYLALVRPPGQGLASEFAPEYPPQVRGISYGLLPESTGEYRFFDMPTPGRANAASGHLGIVEGVEFSVDRGFHHSPLDVDLSCPTPDVAIRYTLDMSEPTPANGIVHVPGATIPVTGTTAIRARAFKPGWLPGTPATRSYIFPADVFAQPASPPGLPPNWGTQAAMYEMKSDVLDRYTPAELESALLSLPTISVVSETPDLFSSAHGIYYNRFADGVEWERPASMEWIDPNGGPEIQLNCGLRLQGNAARIFPKKPFRLLFKGIYGATSLEFPMFADFPDAVTSFDTITLRSNSQDRIWGAIMQITDENGRRTLLDMGTPQSHGTFVHLFINGLYWGLYNAVERPQASFCADYFGGDKDEWDVNNGDKPIDGTREPLDAMLSQVRGGPPTDAAFQKIQGNFPDGRPDPDTPAYIDMPNYLDYMLANFYLGTGDWAGNPSQGTRNYYAGRHRVPDSPGYHWFIWDAERSLQNGIPTGAIYGPAEPFAWLKNNAEFRLRFADHAQRHLRNGGALTPARRQPAFTALADRIRAAIILDEARWDQTTVDGFESNIASRTAWFPGRTDAVLNRFRNEGLFPQTDAPVFSQHGGDLTYDNPLTLATQADAIHYTLDGTDPRLFGGAIAPAAIAASLSGGSPKVSDPIFFAGTTTLKARAYNSATSEWSALLAADFSYIEVVPERIDLIEGGAAQTFVPTYWFGAPITHADFLTATTGQPDVASAVIDENGNLILNGPQRGGTALTVTYNDGENPPAEIHVPVLVQPSAHRLADGTYHFDAWEDTAPAGDFPPHMIFLQGRENDSSLATALDLAYHIPADDAAASSDVLFPYAASSRTRINGLGENGISFINTGRGRDLGGALLALDTTGTDAATVACTVGTILPNSRAYAIRLQYRIGHTGPFADLTDDGGDVVEYLRNDTPGHEEILGPVALPAELLGQAYVQLLWRYHRVSGTSGPRAQLRLDDIRVMSAP